MFEEIIGNNDIKKYFIKSFEENTLSHSYIFTGKSGIGKKKIAESIAKNLILKDLPQEEIKKRDINNITDLKVINPENDTIKIAQIREITEHIFEKPIKSNKKIYIVNDADMMNEESQNSFLKTLEEPPEYAIIFLIVSNENKLLETIKSRCIIIKFKDLTNDEIKQYIKLNNIEIGDNQNEKIELLSGSLEKINNIQEYFDEYNKIEILINLLKSRDIVKCLNNADILYNSKDNIQKILDLINVILFKYKMFDCVEIVEKTKAKLMANCNYDMTIDYLIFNICNRKEI